MQFDKQAFTARWRETCVHYGVDPVEGSVGIQSTAAAFRQTRFGRAIASAEQSKAAHHQRMRQLVYSRQYARVVIPKPDTSHYWIYLFGNDHGGIDWDMVEARAGRSWWQQSGLWVSGPPRFTTDRQVDIKLHGDPPPQPEVGAVCSLYLQAEAIEKQRASERKAALAELVPTDEALRGILHEIYMELRELQPLKRLHERQQVAGVVFDRGSANKKLTVVKSPAISQRYNY